MVVFKEHPPIRAYRRFWCYFRNVLNIVKVSASEVFRLRKENHRRSLWMLIIVLQICDAVFEQLGRHLPWWLSMGMEVWRAFYTDSRRTNTQVTNDRQKLWHCISGAMITGLNVFWAWNTRWIGIYRGQIYRLSSFQNSLHFLPCYTFSGIL